MGIIRCRKYRQTKASKKRDRALRARRRAKKQKPLNFIGDFQGYLNEQNYKSEQWFITFLQAQPTIPNPERNKPIGPYYADFCWEKLKLIVEIDGNYHYSDEQQEKDQRREQSLKELGYRVLRLDYNHNHQAREVITQIRNECWELRKKEAA